MSESTVWAERSHCPAHLMVFPMPSVHLPAQGKRSFKHNWLPPWDVHLHPQPAGPVASSHLPLPSITGGLRISVQENRQIAFGSLSPFPCPNYANSENETNEQIQEIGCGFPVPLFCQLLERQTHICCCEPRGISTCRSTWFSQQCGEAYAHFKGGKPFLSQKDKVCLPKVS